MSDQTHNIQSLREVLFETLNGVKTGSVDVARAKSINETAQTIINSLKAEIDYIRVAGGKTKFIDQLDHVGSSSTQPVAKPEPITVDLPSPPATSSKKTEALNNDLDKLESVLAKPVQDPLLDAVLPVIMQNDQASKDSALCNIKTKKPTPQVNTSINQNKTSRKTSTGTEYVEEKNGMIIRTHQAGGKF
ncbi:hypothetical protein [Ferrovum myxofaciens]|uniref:Uncharacterized protein n=1 Tax=Ferrovum myxofaciens TaxID=416213 RepID=A0A9E6MYJ4_9PROT|nr:hypothetical protein [Ferrovum myxofaciens]QKE37424.1 MAG: hypothetical protein HO273_00655 [Ferrovum myxofaciens]QWY75072.1 MAG: hypothetical protein JVY19_01080 [Ferrovum myxofaciens]QWY77808.1 MAG: hypothetical protein JZL65_01590 [Ferrovum myxofaciens]